MYYDVCVSGFNPVIEQTVVYKLLVDAETFGEAEAKATSKMMEENTENVSVRTIKRSRISEVIDDNDGLMYYQCCTEIQGVENKPFKRLFLVLSNNTLEAEQKLRKSEFFDTTSDSVLSIITTKYYSVI